jgi:carbamoyltransferase
MGRIVKILGISAFYHDSAACLLADGKILAAAQEERFTRKKHDSAFPAQATAFCLREAGVGLEEVDYVIFYDKPLLKFERLLETYLHFAPRGRTSFIKAIPVWLKEKLFLKRLIRQELAKLGQPVPELLFNEHHQSHAASAFFPSPFEKAAVLCLDGVGEWATSSVWLGEGNRLTPQWQIDFPHSLGLLYSAFTYHAGFKVNSGEYKLMGLAPYGSPIYREQILSELLDLKEDGTFRLNMSFFDYATGLRMTNRRFDQLFGSPPRKPESPVTQREMDMAASIQSVTEEVVLRLGKTIRRELGTENLCLAGGVALNCVANGKLWKEKIFENIWVQPAAGDAGGAVGAALSCWHQFLEKPRRPAKPDAMAGGYLGPAYSTTEAKAALTAAGAVFHELDDEKLFPAVAELLAQGSVVGWFQGRMEFGPRALGGRSILGDPRSAAMQSVMNLKIKFRESFRPFAPSVRKERVSEYFEFDGDSPYMLMVAPVRQKQRLPVDDQSLFGIEKLKAARSTIPAVTHVDYSARLQTVDTATNPRYHRLLLEFERLTGCPMVVNTSFNVRGEPLVCSPEDAFRCFLRTEMEYLVVENLLLKKSEQTKREDAGWQKEFELD